MCTVYDVYIYQIYIFIHTYTIVVIVMKGTYKTTSFILSVTPYILIYINMTCQYLLRV